MRQSIRCGLKGLCGPGDARVHLFNGDQTPAPAEGLSELTGAVDLLGPPQTVTENEQIHIPKVLKKTVMSDSRGCPGI